MATDDIGIVRAENEVKYNNGQCIPADVDCFLDAARQYREALLAEGECIRQYREAQVKLSEAENKRKDALSILVQMATRGVK